MKDWPSGKITTFIGYRFWCPRAQISSNLKGRNLDHWNLHSTLKILYAACFCLSLAISAQFALEMCLAAQNHQKSIKPLFGCSRSSKVIAVSANRKPMYNFLLVINSNLGPISHRFWDTVTYWLKITNFLYPISLSALESMEKLKESWN